VSIIFKHKILSYSSTSGILPDTEGGIIYCPSIIYAHYYLHTMYSRLDFDRIAVAYKAY